MTDNIVNIEKARKKTRKTGGFLGLFLLVLVLGILLLSPVFSVETINVEGNSRLSENTIIGESGLYFGQNIFCINKTSAIIHIMKLPYVAEVTIRRDLPNTLNIFVKEKTPITQIKFYGSKLLVAKDKSLLSVVTDDTELDLPELEGFSITNVTAGEQVQCSETEKLDSFFEVLNNFEKNDMLNKILKISEKEGIIVYLKEGHMVNLGDTSNLPYKLLLLKEIIPKEKNTSYIDLRNLEKKITKPVWGMLNEPSEKSGEIPQNTGDNSENIVRGENNEE